MDNIPQLARVPFDTRTYARRSREGPCFVCAILDGHPGYSHHCVYEDDDTIAFLNRYPTLLGYCLVAPKRHVESWVHDLDDEEFLALQHVVRRVAKAAAAVVPTERMYCLSLGSQQGNAHKAPRAIVMLSWWHRDVIAAGKLPLTHRRRRRSG
jgi:galactose-1-phosphate uridylyltransferase